MAIKASGGNPPTNSLSFTDIENEFGQHPGVGNRTLGNYRLQGVSVGDLNNVSLSRDGCGINADSSIPVNNNPIRFSDFYNAKQNIIVDFFTKNQDRVNAKTGKYNSSNPSGNYVVLGPGSKPSDTSGKKVIIHVTKLIGSVRGTANRVALRTGTWNNGTDLLVEVAEGGVIAGAGGKGGNGRNNASGEAGENGTSGLGVEYDGTKIQTTGGKIICGFGGGGAGGGGDTKKEASRWGRGRGPEVKVGGGGGGGGQGVPGGPGGSGGEGRNGTAGDHEAAGNGAEGFEGRSSGGGQTAIINAGDGGEGGHVNDNSADRGENSSLGGIRHENPRTTSGGSGGGNGAAIRRSSGVDFTLVGNPNITGSTNATGMS